MDRIIKFVMGLAAGAAAGYAAGLLLSPESGADNVNRVRQRIDSAITAGQRAAADRRHELESQLAQNSRPTAG